MATFTTSACGVGLGDIENKSQRNLACGGCGTRPSRIGLRIASVVAAAAVTFLWMVVTCCGRGCLRLLMDKLTHAKDATAATLAAIVARARWEGPTGDAQMEG